MCPASFRTSPLLRVLLTRSLPARSTSVTALPTTRPSAPSRVVSSASVKTQWERLDSRLSWCSPITRLASPFFGGGVSGRSVGCEVMVVACRGKLVNQRCWVGRLVRYLERPQINANPPKNQQTAAHPHLKEQRQRLLLAAHLGRPQPRHRQPPAPVLVQADLVGLRGDVQQIE